MPEDLCHTSVVAELRPWFKAILRAPVVVDRVVIVNRMNPWYLSRLNGAEVNKLSLKLFKTLRC